MKRKLYPILLLSALWVCGLQAQVYTPRLATDRLPDYTDIDRFVNWDKWQGLAPQDKATAIWQFLTDRETGLYPIMGIYEDPDPGNEFAFYDERDLVKVLNVHGHGYCGLLSPTLDGIYAHAGFTDSRIHNMDANHHCITEVFYSGGWHYFDMDLRGMLYKPDGTVASVREAMTEKELWTRPPRKVEPFYPLDDKAQMFASFAACKLTPMYHWWKDGHTMDFVLRPGESLTRYWQPQGSRWFDPWPNPGGFDSLFLMKKFEQPPRGLKSKHDGWSRWTHGNALFSWSPKLSDAYEDFERGVYDCRGVHKSARGLEADSSGESWAEFEVRSPYIIVGQVHAIDMPEKIDDGATAYFRSLGPVRVSVSVDNGATWKEVGGTDGEKSLLLDFTQQVIGRYGYILRFDFGPGSGLAELTMDTWCQLAPVSLPRLLRGANTLTFASGDHYGQPTTVKEIRLNLRDPAALSRLAVQMDANYDPARENAKLKGSLVLAVGSKPGTKIKWLNAGGYFRTYTGKAAANDRNAIHWSTAGPGGPWTELESPPVPQWVASWHYGMGRDLVLPAPADTVWLKYVGDPGLNQIWVYAHCLPRTAPAVQPLRVTLAYALDGERTEEALSVGKTGEMYVECPAEPENLFLRFALDNCPRGN